MPNSAKPVCEVLPPLPVGSVDVDALAAALKAGKSGEDAIDEAVAAAAAPISVTGKTKAELLGIASSLGLSVSENATNAEIASAIEDSPVALAAKTPAAPPPSDPTE